jgi:hypothetical protein
LVRENGRLLSRIHENHGSILVYARVRPPTQDELKVSGVFGVVDVLNDTDLAFYDSAKRYGPRLCVFALRFVAFLDE